MSTTGLPPFASYHSEDLPELLADLGCALALTTPEETFWMAPEEKSDV